MKLPLDTNAFLCVTSNKAVRDGDEWTVIAAVASPDGGGQLKIHFDSDPGIQPGPFVLEAASADVRHISGAKVRQTRQEQG